MDGFIYSKISGWKFESEISYLIQQIDMFNAEKREKENKAKGQK